MAFWLYHGASGLTLIMLFAAAFTEAMGGNGSNNPNNPNLSGNSGNAFNRNNNGLPQYSLNQHVSIDPDDDSVSTEAETEAVAFYSSDDEGVEPSPSSLYPGSFISADPLACNGGGIYGGDPGTSFVAMAECRFETRGGGLESDLDDDDEESDDDDDEDDDGHSSMLSNASLRKSLASANGVTGGRSYSHNDHKRSKQHRSQATSMPRTNGRKSCTSSVSLTSALRLRGGAAAIQDGTEFARRLFIAAIVTLIYEAVVGHLLEFIKIVMQTSPPGTSYGDVLKKITAEKGIAGVWDGFVPWGVIQSIFKGGVFGLAHAVALSYLLPLADNGKIPKQLALTLAGGIGGGFQGYVLSPTLLLKTRVMTNPVFRENMSLLRTTLMSFRIGFDVVKEEGVGALMKGSNVFATKRVFDWATRYFFSDLFESLLLRHSSSESLRAGEKIAASLLGGTASTLVTLPLDVLVAKTQDAKKAGVKVSPFKLFMDELNEGGLKGLRESYMQGFEARLAHVCLTTVAMKTGTVFLYDALYGAKS